MPLQDKNGQITIEELKKVFGGLCDEATLAEMIAEADTDHDRQVLPSLILTPQISFNEFKTMMDKFKRLSCLEMRHLGLSG